MATPAPPTPAPSNKNSLPHIVVPRPIHVTIATPRKKVLATALRQPMQISHQYLDFSLSPGAHQMAVASGIGQSKVRSKEPDISLSLALVYLTFHICLDEKKVIYSKTWYG